MDRSKVHESILLAASFAALSYGARVAFPVDVHAAACCGGQSGNCRGNPVEYCIQGTCDSSPLTSSGYCGTHS